MLIRGKHFLVYVIRVGAWCLDSDTHVLSFGFVMGFGHSHSTSCCVSVRAWFRSAVDSSVHVCLFGVAPSSCCFRLGAFMLRLVLCGTQLVYFFGCVLLCCHVLCEHVAYEFSHECPVLHMAGDLFCWRCACVFVLCENMAFVLVFYVPCALMSIVLTPPILLPDYWLICPTCLPSLPSSFAPFIISLLPCPGLPGFQLSCFSPTR